MKQSFNGYYAPTAEEYARLWSDGLIVLDTNVILNIYRLPTNSQEEFLKLLETLKDRLWIPYHVGLEFQRRRITVIATERKSTEDVLSFARKNIEELLNKVRSLEIDNRSLGLETDPLIKSFTDANSKLEEAIKSVHNAQLDVSAIDPIRDRLDNIFSEKVGPGPSSQEELNDLVKDGEFRYDEEIPPGFEDAGKSKNPDEATFIHDTIKYERKFGDLIIWRQLINYASKTNCKKVILVTADKKDDWWWREYGKTVGPHPELIREIKRLGSVDLFWMYSPDQFLRHAGVYTQANVSDSAVAELQIMLASDPADQVTANRPHMRDIGAFFSQSRSKGSTILAAEIAEKAVYNWLRIHSTNIQVNKRFPDFTVKHGSENHGFEVVFSRRMNSYSRFREAILRGTEAISQGEIDRFALVAVLPIDYDEIMSGEHLYDRFRRALLPLIIRHPEVSIIFGVIKDDGNFAVLWRYTSDDSSYDLEDFQNYTNDP